MAVKPCDYCGELFSQKNKNHRVCGKGNCLRVAAKERVARWRERFPDGNTEASRRRRAEMGYPEWPAKRALGLEIKKLKSENPCTDCGNIFPPECMDFDHVRGEKKYSVGTMVSHGHSRDSVMAEIAKCELVCANCHRIRTRQRKLGTRNIPKDTKTE